MGFAPDMRNAKKDRFHTVREVDGGSDNMECGNYLYGIIEFKSEAANGFHTMFSFLPHKEAALTCRFDRVGRNCYQFPPP